MTASLPVCHRESRRWQPREGVAHVCVAGATKVQVQEQPEAQTQQTQAQATGAELEC